MKPDVDGFLEVASLHLVGELSPRLPTAYEQSATGALGIVLLALREEFGRAASRRVEENAALRALFGRAVPVVADTALRTRLESAAASADPGLEIAALDGANDDLRALLIELHAHVEELDSPAARALDDAIWRELSASTERRRLSIAVF